MSSTISLYRRRNREFNEDLAVVNCINESCYFDVADVLALRVPLESAIFDIALFPAGTVHPIHEITPTIYTSAGVLEQWRSFLTPPIDPSEVPVIPLEDVDRVIRGGPGGMKIVSLRDPHSPNVLLNCRHLHWSVIHDTAKRLLPILDSELADRFDVVWIQDTPDNYGQVAFNHFHLSCEAELSESAHGLHGIADWYWVENVVPLQFEALRSRYADPPESYRDGTAFLRDLDRLKRAHQSVSTDDHEDEELPALDSQTAKSVLDASRLQDRFPDLPFEQALEYVADQDW